MLEDDGECWHVKGELPQWQGDYAEVIEKAAYEEALDVIEGLLPLPRGFPGEGCGPADEATALAFLRAQGRDPDDD